MPPITAEERYRREQRERLCVLIFVPAGISMGFAAKVYSHGWVAVLLAGLVISWLSMNFWAVTLERRTLLDPRKQYWQYYFGDLFFLPGVMVCFALLQARLGHAVGQSAWWSLPCIVVSFYAGGVFHWKVDAPKDGGYTYRQWESPTKLWHDLFVIPVFLFYLAVQLPLLWSSVSWKGATGWLLSILTLIFVALWASLMFVDGARKPSPLTTAHVNYDWARLRPVKA